MWRFMKSWFITDSIALCESRFWKVIVSHVSTSIEWPINTWFISLKRGINSSVQSDLVRLISHDYSRCKCRWNHELLPIMPWAMPWCLSDLPHKHIAVILFQGWTLCDTVNAFLSVRNYNKIKKRCKKKDIRKEQKEVSENNEEIKKKNLKKKGTVECQESWWISTKLTELYLYGRRTNG